MSSESSQGDPRAGTWQEDSVRALRGTKLTEEIELNAPASLSALRCDLPNPAGESLGFSVLPKTCPAWGVRPLCCGLPLKQQTKSLLFVLMTLLIIA